MAYYNNFIWMVMIMITYGISSAVSTGNKKDPLKQKLLDDYESRSTSAVPTKNEMDLSKLTLKDEFNSGPSSAEPTVDETDLSKLIEEFNYVQALNRGSFASPQIDIKEFDVFYKVRDILLTAKRELICNYTYDMLVFMNLMTPENYTNKKLYDSVDKACSNWAQHMLNAIINSSFPLKGIFPYPQWMFYFYTKKMKTFAMRGAMKEMKSLYDYMQTHFNEQMDEQCKNVWPKTNKYDSYAGELNSLSPNSALKKLTGACIHLSKMSKTKLIHVDDIESSLYINNVVENAEIMRTLVTSFGGLYNGDQVVRILSSAMNKAKNPTSLLSDSIHSLKVVHSYFMQMVKTIMLRICWAVLDKLKSVNNRPVAEQVQTLLYKQHLNDFASLLKLNKEDELMILITEISPSSSTIEEQKSSIRSLLKIYDTEKHPIIFFNYDRAILETIDFQTSTLLVIAQGIRYNIAIPIRSSVRESILCAEVFVEYLKHILNAVNFNVLKSFENFERLVSFMIG